MHSNKQFSAVFFLLCVCFSHGELNTRWSKHENNPIQLSENRQKRDIDGPLSKDDPSVINAEFKTVYQGLVDNEKSFSYIYTEITNLTSSVRLAVWAQNVSEEFPVLFVVKTQRNVLAWQVPLMLENTYGYNNVSRTICPLNRRDAEHEKTQEIVVDVTSMNSVPTMFTLTADLVILEISTNLPWQVEVSPPEPKYFRYTFPDDVSAVIISLRSDDSLCMVLSVQDIHCPVYDLVRNVEFSGSYQTVTKRGAITVPRDVFKPWGAFFVVLVVKPNDIDCAGVENVYPIPPDGPRGDKIFAREKSMVVTVVPAISEQQYLGAILGAVAWFLVLYLAALAVSFIYRSTSKSAAGSEPLGDQEGCVNADARDRNLYDALDETQVIVSGPHTPLDGPANGSYGAMATSGDVATSAGSSGGLSGAEFSKSNGIPHRIPPPNELGSDAGSELDEQDIDMLHDIDEEKDVFRTKTFLYVADLARKPRSVLSKKYRLYHWILITISIFYFLPVIQLVVTYQTVLHKTGNEDICYYNFDCARPLGMVSAFNNVFSNIGYILLGLLFLIIVACRDRSHRALLRQNDRFEKHYGIPQHFGLFYALGVALTMEGLLSGCYHVCPSYSNYQYDTSYMYMIAWLGMLKIYQIRHPDINANAHTAYFAISLVIFLAVLGVVYGSVLFWVVYTCIHILATLLLSFHIYYMGRWKLDLGVFRRIYLLLRADRFHCMRPMYMDRMILLVIGNLVNWSLAIYGLITEPRDFATYLLGIFIINLLMYFAFYIIMKLRNGERLLPLTVILILIATVVWAAALYFFLARSLTSWQKTPAMSREQNEKCRLLDFYDDHDIWHFLSSMSLFFSFMVLFTIDDDLLHVPRDRIPVF